MHSRHELLSCNPFQALCVSGNGVILLIHSIGRVVLCVYVSIPGTRQCWWLKSCNPCSWHNRMQQLLKWQWLWFICVLCSTYSRQWISTRRKLLVGRLVLWLAARTSPGRRRWLPPHRRSALRNSPGSAWISRPWITLGTVQRSLNLLVELMTDTMEEWWMWVGPFPTFMWYAVQSQVC